MSMVTSPTRRRVVATRVCVVGTFPKLSQVVSTLENHFKLEVVRSENGEPLSNDDETLYVVADFDCAAFKRLHGTGAGAAEAAEYRRLIAGPPYVLTRTNKSELVCPRPHRPMYCDLLREVSIVLGGDLPDKRRIVDIVHFMGGSARKEVTGRTTHYISTVATGKFFRQMISLGKATLRPDWLLEVWRERDNPNFNPLDPAVTDRHRLAVFENLHVMIVGFSEEDRADMEKHVRENKGSVTTVVQEATHMVCADQKVDERMVDVAVCRYVSAEWLWESIQLGACANEDNYSMRPMGASGLRKRGAAGGGGGGGGQWSSPAHRNKSASSILDLDHSNSSLLNDHLSTDDLEKLTSSPKKVDKRHHVLSEMVDTEANYVRSMDLMMQFKTALEERDAEQLLTREEVVLIFGKVRPLMDVHEKIRDELGAMLAGWEKNSRQDIGRVWLSHAAELERAYPAFINTMDRAKGTLEEADRTRPKFHIFLRTRESKPEFKRQQLRELLIRPVQRLPSVVLLLKELLKRSDKQKESLQEAIKAVEKIIMKANETRRKNDQYSKFFELTNDIENLPAFLVSSQRQFHAEMEVVCIGGTGQWKTQIKRTIKLFLFNDCVELAKVRQESRGGAAGGSGGGGGGGGTISRMQRQFSQVNIRGGTAGGERRKYKHIEIVFLTAIRNIYRIEAADGTSVYSLLIRDSKADEEWVVQATDLDDQHVLKFFEHIDQQVFLMTGREMDLQRLKVEELTDDRRETYKMMMLKEYGRMMCVDDGASSVSSASRHRLHAGGGERGYGTWSRAAHSSSTLSRARSSASGMEWGEGGGGRGKDTWGRATLRRLGRIGRRLSLGNLFVRHEMAEVREEEQETSDFLNNNISIQKSEEEKEEQAGGGEEGYARCSGRDALNATLGANHSTLNATVHRQPGQFRRALSNASLTLSHQFGKLSSGSRANLKHIAEDSSVSGSPLGDMNSPAGSSAGSGGGGPDSTFATPSKRGLRQRLTSSTFLPKALIRKSSVKENLRQTQV